LILTRIAFVVLELFAPLLLPGKGQQYQDAVAAALHFNGRIRRRRNSYL
jgi:hypothetical protein